MRSNLNNVYVIAALGIVQMTLAYLSNSNQNYNGLYSGQQQAECGLPTLPNIIHGQYIDPEKVMGTWYCYNAWFPNITERSISVNTINYYTSFGQGHFPTTDIPASIITQEMTFYAQDGDTSCRYLHENAYLTVDGRQIGLFFNLTFADLPVAIDNSVVWVTDYDSFVFLHACFNPQPNGSCGFPFLYVNTRRKPQDVTAAERQKINDAINYAVRRYCLDAGQFVIYQWIDALPACPRTAGTSCHQSVKAAFAATIEIL